MKIKEVILRKWKLADAQELSHLLSNPNILKNLRDGIPYPYTEADTEAYIKVMLDADENSTFAYAVCVEGIVVGSIRAVRQLCRENKTQRTLNNREVRKYEKTAL
ncbi:MAG: GNAT family N-acetyltransferase [Eubacteriales bacterium]|nr:GNAT family N-acetyltransferase [Eubacteriales bacterium]